MLQATSPARAVEYFLQIYDQIPGLDEMMQLAVIELVRKEARGSEGALKVSPTVPLPRAQADGLPQQARYIKCIFELLNATSHSVKYEAATALTTLTQNPAAVKGE